jgi:predicted peroxiredoxin
MNLPKIDLPTFEFVIPSTGKTIKFRPFLVKEQKILLIALESGKEKDIVDAVKQIVTNCVIDSNFDVNKMAAFDLEYFFIHLRARSIGEKVNMSFRCKNTINEEECNNLMQFEHDLLSATVVKSESQENTIFFTKEVGVVMKYPTINSVEKIMGESKKKSVENALDMIVESIDYFFDKDNIYHIKEMDKNEVIDYIENIPKASFDKIEKFFNNMPYVKSIIEHKCEKCGFEHKIPLEGLTSFFE